MRTSYSHFLKGQYHIIVGPNAFPYSTIEDEVVICDDGRLAVEDEELRKELLTSWAGPKRPRYASVVSVIEDEEVRRIVEAYSFVKEKKKLVWADSVDKKPDLGSTRKDQRPKSAGSAKDLGQKNCCCCCGGFCCYRKRLKKVSEDFMNEEIKSELFSFGSKETVDKVSDTGGL